MDSSELFVTAQTYIYSAPRIVRVRIFRHVQRIA